MASTTSRTTEITGSTKLFAIVGDPVDQVKAPAALNAIFAQLRMNAVMIPIHAGAEHFAEIIHGLKAIRNMAGLIITVPYKFAVVDFADTVSSTVELAGTANVMRRDPGGLWSADSYDGAGFVRGLLSDGYDPAGTRVMLAGAGGAGSSIATALLAAGAAQVTVLDTDQAQQAALVFRLNTRWPGHIAGSSSPDLNGVDLAVNATPVGLRPDDPLPFLPELLPKTAVVADIIMRPHQTRLLQTSLDLGLRIHHGIHMMDGQLDLYREFFGLR